MAKGDRMSLFDYAKERHQYYVVHRYGLHTVELSTSPDAFRNRTPPKPHHSSPYESSGDI